MHESESRTQISVEVEPHGSVLGGGISRGCCYWWTLAWEPCVVCGLRRPDPRTSQTKKPFRALPTPSAAAMLGQEYIYCCRANKPALICPNGFELVPSGFFFCVNLCVRFSVRACSRARDAWASLFPERRLFWAVSDSSSHTHTHSRRCNHARTHFPYKQQFISAFNAGVFNC